MRAMKSIRFRECAAIACVMAVAGCGAADPVDVDLDLVGDYELASITYE